MEIKGYRIRSEINRGPITTVFLAEQTSLDRLVLLKVLNIQWRNETDLVERFRREAKIYARLKHPNIVTVFDFGISEDTFFIAAEYVDGQELSTFIKKHRPLSPVLVSYILRETLKGLAYAHEKGVLHRDIKPDNIMISSEGNVKITDFGLATIADLPSLTNQDSLIGTPAYMSPEQTKGKKLDQRSDLFSLGATLYEMLIGVSPFKDQNVALTINRILNHQPAAPISGRPETPGWLSDLTMKLLEKEPVNRPVSAVTILEQYQQALSSTNTSQLTAVFQNNVFDPHPSITGTRIYNRSQTDKKSKKIFRVISTFIILIIVAYLFSDQLSDQPVPPVDLKSDLTVSDTLDQKNRSDVTQISESNDSMVEKTVELIPDQNPIIEYNPQAQTAEKSKEPDPMQNSVGNTEFNRDDSSPQFISGSLHIICHPWAEIYIDNRYVETTPIEKAINLLPGVHSIELRNPGYLSYSREVTVTAGHTDTLTVRLQPSTGYLSVQVIPWGKIYINGIYRETTPMSQPLQLKAGEHAISIENPNFESIKDTILIEAGKNFTKNYYFGN